MSEWEKGSGWLAGGWECSHPAVRYIATGEILEGGGGGEVSE